MKYVTEFVESFREGVLHATHHKVIRWISVTLLVLVMLACWVSGAFALTTGNLQGIALIAYGFVFLLNLYTFVTLFHTDEIHRRTREIQRQTWENIARTHDILSGMGERDHRR